MVSFTHHNIRLDDGTLTKPEIGFLLSDSPWFLAAKPDYRVRLPRRYRRQAHRGPRLPRGRVYGRIRTNGNGGLRYRGPPEQFRGVRIRESSFGSSKSSFCPGRCLEHQKIWRVRCGILLWITVSSRS